MKELKPWWVLILLSLVFQGCQKELPPIDYLDWVRNPENGLLKTKQIENIKVSALLKPIDYTLALGFGDGDKAAYEKQKDALGEMIYLDLKIGRTTGEDLITHDLQSDEERQSRIYYLSYSLQNDIKLLDGDEIVNCALFHFERSYNLGENKSFVLGFPKKNTSTNDLTLIVDSPFLGTGPIKIKFKKEDLQKIPTLKL